MELSSLIWFASGIGTGALVVNKINGSFYTPKMKELTRLVSFYRSRYLNILQRELANFLIRKNPKNLLRLYENIHAESEGIKTARSEVLKARLLLLTEKYPTYDDFDIIGSRDYVLYDDALISYTSEEIEQHYTDLRIFQEVQSKTTEDWPMISPTSDREYELENLKEYAQRVADTKFKSKLKKAISDFYTFRKDNEKTIETDEFSVHWIDHPADDIRYGIHIKADNEFGMYSCFVFDDGRADISYYRSDAEFKKQEGLNDLLLDEGI